MLGDDDVFGRKLQTLGEHLDEPRVEGQRTALEHHRRIDVQALSQAADGLLRHGMKGRKRDVGLGNTLVEQGLDVGFRVNAATTRNVVGGATLTGKLVVFLNGDFQKRGYLVDEGAGAARARAVHTHIAHGKLAGALVLAEEHHLRILPAQLDGATSTRVQSGHSLSVGHHLLHEGDARGLGQGLAAAAA